MVLVVGQYFDAPPAPVDAVSADQSVLDLHDFDEVHLLTVRRLPRILPGGTASVGKETCAVIVPLDRRSSHDLGQERPKFVMPTTHTAPAQNVCRDRAFQRRVRRITGQQGFYVVVCQRFFPRMCNCFDAHISKDEPTKLRCTSKHSGSIVGPMRKTGGGEPDLAAVATAFADPRRIRILLALADGRALPAGRLAEEAGVAAATTSSHLAQLMNRGLVTVEQQGRSRYYRMATPEVGGVLEALAHLAPQQPITSLREHTRAHALRTARTCYGHLAGQLGVRLFHGMITHGWVTGNDGLHHPDQGTDRLSAPGRTHAYRLTDRGATALTEWGMPTPLRDTATTLRYCVDWTEQAHHLAGAHGSALTNYLLERNWIRKGRVPRSITITPAGERHLEDLIGTDVTARGR